MKTPKEYAKVGKTLLAAAMLGVVLLVAGAPAAHADERPSCQARIEKAEARLDEAIRRQGEHSDQARDRRHELREQCERCWRETHAWRDAHAHQWHTNRDWDHDEDRH